MRHISLQGILYDEKSSFLRGAAKAPPEIRRVLKDGSSNFTTESEVNLAQHQMVDLGDFSPYDYFDIEKITAANLRSGNPLISLGGDHSVTYPIVKAVAKLNEPFDILHIDAHTDLYDEFEGDRYSHACPFARIMEEKLAGKLYQVGIRTLTDHHRSQVDKYHVEVRQMKNLDLSNLMHFKRPIYISLDLDGIDPAFAPGVSHHEPGGLTPRQVIDLVNGIETKIIGADIVEYNPSRDVQGITAALAVKLLKEIWGRMILNNK